MAKQFNKNHKKYNDNTSLLNDLRLFLSSLGNLKKTFKELSTGIFLYFLRLAKHKVWVIRSKAFGKLIPGFFF